MVRKTLVAMAATALLLTAFAAQALAHPPPTHLHCLTTPGGVHSIARGVTLHANHETAFHNLHSKVHQGAFADHPLGPLDADFLREDQTVFTCPPTLP